MILLESFPDEYNKNITRTLMETFKGVLPHTLYFNMEPTSEYQTILDKYSGFGEAASWADGADVTLDDPIKEFDRTAKQEGYGLGFKVGRHMLRYDMKRIVNKWGKRLGDSFLSLLRTKHAYVLNNAFATVTYGDGKVLCATDHPTAGSTRSNVLATATALNFASFDSVRLLGVQHVDYRGKPTAIHFDQLIVPEQLTVTAAQIIGSPQQPFTTDNQINPFAGGYSTVTEDRITSSTAWFMQARNNHGLLSLTGYPVTPDAYVEQSSKSLVHYLETDFKVDVEDWPGIAGTAGA
jgi:hypothetical protein